jgi:hypothetical protein
VRPPGSDSQAGFIERFAIVTNPPNLDAPAFGAERFLGRFEEVPFAVANAGSLASSLTETSRNCRNLK